MLRLTDSACTIVRTMTDAPDVPPTAGVRISEAPEGFAVTAAASPVEGDSTVEQDGAIVYLDERAAESLRGLVLDAGLDGTGSLQFGLLRGA